MRCLHCGKKLSFLRKFSDGQFCSADHREAYHRQQDDLALARLIESQTRIAAPQTPVPAAAPPKSKKKKREEEPAPPFGGVLPEELRTAKWRRICCPELDLEPIPTIRLSPESPCRVSVRGFPRAGVTPVLDPVAPKGGAPHGAAMPAEFTPVLAPPSTLTARSAAASPALVDALLPLASPEISAKPPRVHAITPSRGRKKLVVILPRSIRAQSPARFELGLVEALPAALVKARPCAPVWRASMEAGETAPSLPVIHSLLLPPEDLDSSAAATPAGAREFEPAMAAAVCLDIPGLRLRAEKAAAALLSFGRVEVTGALPICPLQALTAPPPAGLAEGCLEALPAGSTAEMPRPGPSAMWTGPLWPRHEAGQPPERAVASDAVPRLQFETEPQAVETRVMAAAAGVGYGPPAPILQTEGAAPPRRDAGMNSPAPAWAPAAALGETPLAGLARPSLAGACVLPIWNVSEAMAPRRLLVPSPPELLPLPDTLPGPVVETIPAEAVVQPPVPVPLAPADDAALDESDAVAPPPLWGRLPMMPMRPMDATARQASEAGRMTCWIWTAIEERGPKIPDLRLTVDHADGSGPRRHRRAAKASPKRRIPFLWGQPRRRFWSHAPADLKWVALALPLLLVLVVYSFQGKTPNKQAEAKPAAEATTINGKTVLTGQLNTLQRVILDRAAVRLYDDFRSGLGSWQGKEGWSATWKYGEASFLEPGQMALYLPSVGMADYTLQFLGQVERRSLNWAFRARDLNNYYSMRIVITKQSPLPEAHIIRSTVINGKEMDVKSLPIPFPVRIDTLYLVRMEVRGEDFTTYIQGQVVDHFSNTRLSEGGVGFYSPRGDRSLLRWVEVSHQYDYVGRLCALLSPYSMQGMVRGIEQ